MYRPWPQLFIRLVAQKNMRLSKTQNKFSGASGLWIVFHNMFLSKLSYLLGAQSPPYCSFACHLVRPHGHPLLIWSSLSTAQLQIWSYRLHGFFIFGIKLVCLHHKDCQYHQPIQPSNCYVDLGACTGARTGAGRLARTEGVERAAPNRRSARWGALSNAKSNAMRMARRSPRNHDLRHGDMAGSDDFASTNASLDWTAVFCYVEQQTLNALSLEGVWAVPHPK